MTRRNLLTLAASASLLAAGALAGAFPAVRAFGRAAGRSLRAPSDLLARVRRRTRPLREEDLHNPHELAG